MSKELKNILLGITIPISIVAILEAAGIVEIIDSDTFEIAAYCDNSNRNLTSGDKGGGMGIDSTKTVELMTEAKEVIKNTSTKINYEYFLSKNALDSLFKDRTATGIFIAPIFGNEDSINVLVGKSHCKNTLTDPQSGFAFVIKTFCPSDCEME